MKYQISKLDNGLRVVTARMAEAQTVTAHIAVGVGSRYEDFATNGGVSHFLEHLLFKGTKKRPSAKIISEQIDAVGGFNNAYTSNDMTTYLIKLPYQHLSLAMDILADMLTNSLLDPAEIDRERGTVIEEMNMYHDEPRQFVHSLTPKLLWPNQPLGYDIIGSEEVIRSVQRDQIAGYMQRYYVPSNMVVIVAGLVEHDEVVQLSKKLLSGLSPADFPKAKTVSNKPDQQRVQSLQKDTAQAHLAIASLAYPYLDRKDPAARVATTILGRGMSSRLFINVRERKGLAYVVNAGLQNFVDTGQFEVYAGVNLDKVDQAIKAIIEELNDIAAKPVGAAELDKAKNQIKGGLQMAMENNAAVADRAATQMVLLGKIKPEEEIIREIEAVTAADVQKVAAEMLAPGQLRMGIIAPDPEPAIKAFEKAAA